MKQYVIYVFEHKKWDFKEVKNLHIPKGIPENCLYYYFVSGEYDAKHEKLIAQEGCIDTDTGINFINAQIVPRECIKEYFTEEQIQVLKKEIEDFKDQKIEIIKLKNGEFKVTNKSVNIISISAHPAISRQESKN